MSDGPANDALYRLLNDVEFGDGVVVQSFTNLYGCRIGDGTRIGPFVEIQRGSSVGANCKIQSHTFICDGVTIEDAVFVGHGVMFVNDKYPRATNAEGTLQTESDWDTPANGRRDWSLHRFGSGRPGWGAHRPAGRDRRRGGGHPRCPGGHDGTWRSGAGQRGSEGSLAERPVTGFLCS